MKPHENCKTCPLAKMPHVPVTGSSSAEYLLISEHPGDDEAALGINFAGGTGKILRSTLEDLGITHGAKELIPNGMRPDGSYTYSAQWNLEPPEVQFTNIVQCVTPRGSDGKYTKPTPKAIEACAPLLNKVLEESQAKVIVAIGRPALERFIGVDRVRQIEAKPYPTAPAKSCWDMYAFRFGHEITNSAFIGGKVKARTGDVIQRGKNKGERKLQERSRRVPVAQPPVASVVVSAVHPSAVSQRGFAELNNFRAAFSHARDIALGAPIYTEPIGDIFSPHAFQQAVERLAVHNFLAFDIEMPPPYRIISRISFAAEGICGSYDWAQSSTKALTQWLLGPDSPFDEFVAFNSSYDVPRLQSIGGIDIDTTRVRCAMIATMLHEPDLRKSLGHSVPREIITVPWKHKDDDNPKLYSTIDSQLLYYYWPRIYTALIEMGQWDFYLNHMMPGLDRLNRLTRRGIAVHQPYAEKWKSQLQQELADIQEEWDELSGSKNYRSAPQIAKLLFDELHLRPKSHGASGRPSTNAKDLDKILSALKGGREKRCTDPARAVAVLELLMNIRKRTKQLDNYASELAIGPDGAMHPGYLPSGKDFDDALASTLRLAAHNPNIQNQPTLARYMYVPHRSHAVIWSCDFSQIEPRILAELSGEEWLREAFRSGEDIHQKTADILTQRAGKPFSRYEGKVSRHGWAYGMGPVIAAENWKIPIRDAGKILQALDDAHPAIVAYRNNRAETAASQGYLQNPFGTIRRFPDFADRASRIKHAKNKAANFDAQSSVACIMWILLTPIFDALEAIEDAALLTQIHDEFMGECRAEDVDHVAEVVQRIMGREWPQIRAGWSCPTNFTCGPTWGHCKEYKDVAAWREAGGLTWPLGELSEHRV